MIKNFKDKETEKIFSGFYSKKLPIEIQRTALRKLEILNAAALTEDLKIPPGNKLENLKGNRYGQWSIRINNQFRICFNWIDDNAYNVEITDYH